MTTTRAGNGEERNGIEVRARTVDEAVARGLVRLGGLSRAEVRIEVVNAGKGGLLGFGAEEAVVRLVPLSPGETAEAVGAIPTAQPIAPPPIAPRPAAEAAPPPKAPRTRRRADELPVGAAVAPAPDQPPPVSTATAPTPPTAADVEVACNVVRTLLGHLGYDNVTLEVQDTLMPVPVDDEAALVVGIRGPGTERLLAHHDRPLYALQFIARLIVGRDTPGWTNLLLDVNGDRARRLKEIYHMAEQSATLVEREGRPVSLPPMTAYERRVVHLALHNHPTIATQSIGAGLNRKVTVRRKDQLLPAMD